MHCACLFDHSTDPPRWLTRCALHREAVARDVEARTREELGIPERPAPAQVPLGKLRQAIARTEKNFTTGIVAYLRKHGWAVQRHGSMGVGNQHRRGFPDLVAVRGNRVVFMEIKTHHGKVHPDQQTWLDLLRSTGRVEVYVMRPVEWESWKPWFGPE